MTSPRTARWGHLPWWSAALVGVACAVVGVLLIFRPFASLAVLVAVVTVGMVITGIASLTAAETMPRPWLVRAIGLGWIVTGVLIVAWPDITTRAVAVVVGVAMIVSGMLEIVAMSRRATLDRRAAAVIGGVASVVFGALALAWPDVTVLVVAVLFGARLVMTGLRLAWSAVRSRHGDDPTEPTTTAPSTVRRFASVVGALLALLVAVALAGVSSRLNEGTPVVDGFYTTPSEVPTQPGSLLRVESFTRGIPDGAQAWRILYTTTRDEGIPAVASAIVVTPADASGPTPVIAWAHGTTGVARTCAPSVLHDPFGAGAFYSLDRVLAEGWTLVTTDYVGLGTEGPHPYLIGQPEARSVLDSVRATRQMTELDVADDTVVWGHSQGGGAALWTGIVAPDYAPDVALAGVAALAPASDLVGLVGNLGNVPAGSIFATYVVSAYADVYPDISLNDYVAPAGRSTFDATAERCLAEPAALLSVLESLGTNMSVFSTDLASGPLLKRFEENVPDGPIEAPLLLGQGGADQLVLPAVQDQYVATRCANGYDVDYRTYEGRDHVPLVEPDSPAIRELIQWTRDRFAGLPATSNCEGR